MLNYNLLGIGNALTVKLDSFGAKVYAVSKSSTNLAALKSKCPGVETVCVNLTDWNATREAMEKIEPCDGLINNAGITCPGFFMDLTEQEFDE